MASFLLVKIFMKLNQFCLIYSLISIGFWYLNNTLMYYFLILLVILVHCINKYFSRYLFYLITILGSILNWVSTEVHVVARFCKSFVYGIHLPISKTAVRITVCECLFLLKFKHWNLWCSRGVFRTDFKKANRRMCCTGVRSTTFV